MDRTGRDARVCRAALLLGGLLLGVGGVGRASAPGSCDAPRSLPAVRGEVLRVACASGAGAPVDGAAGLLFGRVLDLNAASEESLVALPGVGPGRARAIAAARASRPFASVDDLRRVGGIGPRTVDGLRGWVAVDVRAGPTPGR